MNIVYDIEVYPNFFCFTGVLIDSKEIVRRYSFEISDRINEIDKFKQFLIEEKFNFMVGFNNINYDYPIIHKLYYLNNNDDINEILYDLSCKLISAKTYDDKKEYLVRKSKYIRHQIDLMKIWHFDNKAKRCSLKWIEFMMDWHDLIDLPYDPHRKVNHEQKENLIRYCFNDTEATYKLYQITKGIVDVEALNDYKNKNKFSLRLDILKEYRMPCLNFNDVKIGERFMLNNYCEKNNINQYDLKPVIYKDKFVYGDCFPEYVTFKTKKFNDFINSFRNKEVDLENKQSFQFTVNLTTYTIAKGGIHSEDTERLIIPNENQILRDADVGSQYPNAIRKRKLFPRHLNVSWLDNYTSVIERRLFAKKEFKKTNDYRFKSFDEMYKLALNGGSFGKLGEPTNWQYDPFIQMKVTIGNQMEILMLIEMLEMANIRVISANTDGIVCIFNKNQEDTYNEICKNWEIIVGNQDLGQLEFKDYKLLAQLSVNDYLAIDLDNKVKCKGDFLTEFELHKNKSKRIVPLALTAYFRDKIKPEVFIKNHNNIFDFCISIKGDKETKFFIQDLTIGGSEGIKYLQKVNRFFISDKTNDILVKEMLPLENKTASNQIDIFGNIDNGERYNRIEVGYNVFIINQYDSNIDYKLFINYNYYIEKTYEIIKKVESKILEYNAEIDFN